LSAELLEFVQRRAAMDNLTDDATKVYLFTNSEEMLNAVTRDRRGANLPLLRGAWDFQKEIVLGVQEPFGAGIDPEPALRGMRSNGYFIWKLPHIEPFGSSQ
jgi:hypothetical protein